MRDTRRTPSSRLGAVALAAGAVALGIAACDGSNAFGPVGVGPSIVSLEAPAQVGSGLSLDVSARAVAAIRVDSIVVTVEGAFEARQVESNPRRDADVTFAFDFDVPGTVFDTVAVVTAWAVDAQGNVSAPKSRNVRILDGTPPQVALSGVPDSASQGDGVPVTVTASDNVGLRRVGIEVRDPSGALVHTDSVPASGTSQSHTFTWWIPETPTFGAHTVTGFARDVSGNRSDASATVDVVFEDREDPVVEILVPSTSSFSVVAGDSVRVQARIRDNDALAQVRFRGFAQVGSAELGTLESVERFTPREVQYDAAAGVDDVTLTRYLRFDMASLAATPPLSAQESLALVVEATDRSGRTSADTIMVTLNHDVVPPQVTIDAPAEGTSFYVEDAIGVQFTVSDNQGPVRTGVNAMTIEVKQIVGDAAGGGVNDASLAEAASYTLQDAGRFDPIVSAATFTYTIPEGARSDTQAADGFFFIIVTARDVAGNVGADTLRVRSLGPRPVEDDDDDDPDPAPPMGTPSTAAGAGGAAHLPEPRRLEDGS